MKSIKFVSAVLAICMLFTGIVILIPQQAQAMEYDYKEINPVHVANVSYAYDITCWGEKLAWASGGGNITTGTVSGGAGSVIDAQSWGKDMVMSGSAIAWSAAVTDVTTRSDVYTTGLSGGSRTYQPFNTDKDEVGPRIDGNKIIYESMQESGTGIRVSNIGSSSYTELPIYPESWGYDISGDNVVGTGDYSKLIICDTNGNIEKDYGEGWYAEEGWRISGDYITYYEVTDFGNGAYVNVKNWRTNDTYFVTRMSGQPGGLDIEGNFVVFSASKDPLNGGGACMFLYDIQAQTLFRVSQEYSMIYDYAIGDGWIVWSTRGYDLYGTEYYNIYAAELPAPGAAPDESDQVPDEGDEHIIGVSGGTITREGFNLDIPSGSLGSETTFSVNEHSTSSDDILSAFDILPSGITFNPPAELTLDIPGTRASGNELMKLEDGQWVSVDSTTSSDGGSLIAQITATGSYAVTVARDTVENVIDTAGGIVNLGDVSLDIPVDALSSATDVSITETFVDAANIANAVAVDIGGQILSVPAQLNFNVPSGIDAAETQVGQLVGSSWVKVESTVNSAGQLVADITEGGIYALITTSSDSGLPINIPFPGGAAIFGVFISTALVIGIARKYKFKK